MTIKTRKLSDAQLEPFKGVVSTMGSLLTLERQGAYPAELKNVGVNERGIPNQVIKSIFTQPSGSQLVIEAVFYDPKDNIIKGDLHEVNFKSRELKSHYRGWGTWTEHYGDGHWKNEVHLQAGTPGIE